MGRERAWSRLDGETRYCSRSRGAALTRKGRSGLWREGARERGGKA
jgi:hypothetical protein